MTLDVDLAGAAAKTHELEIIRRGGTMGAEIRGIDLSGPISRSAFLALHDALMDHKVICFRDQDITPEAHIAFAEWLTKRERNAGRLPKGYTYRLPNGWAWLTFARCGDRRKYPWAPGSNPAPLFRHC